MSLAAASVFRLIISSLRWWLTSVCGKWLLALIISLTIQMFGCLTGLKSTISGLFGGADRWDGLFAKHSGGLLLNIRLSGVQLWLLLRCCHVVDGRFRARTGLQLLDGRIVILEIAVLEEDQVMVSMRLYAILAESVSALIAGPFDLFSLMPWLLAVGDALLVRGWSRWDRSRWCIRCHLLWGCLTWGCIWGLLRLTALLRGCWYRLLCWVVAASFGRLGRWGLVLLGGLLKGLGLRLIRHIRL